MSTGEIDQEIVHGYFGLTYAQYLVIPRTALQSMSNEWQRKFIDCMNELDQEIDWKPEGADYWVQLRKPDGTFTSITDDPLNDYERGRRKIQLKSYIAPIKNDGTYSLYFNTGIKYPETVYPFQWKGIQFFISNTWVYDGFSEYYFIVTEKSTGYSIGKQCDSIKESKRECINWLEKQGLQKTQEIITKIKKEVIR